MKCMKCGRTITNTTCDNCGYNIKSNEVSLLASFAFKTSSSIARFVKTLENAKELEAICSNCGKVITVHFTPTANKPVYCTDCSSAIKKDMGEKRTANKESFDFSPPTPPALGGRTSSKKQYEAGSLIVFGRYPQSSSGLDKTPIEWVVLDEKDDELLLISKNVLDVQKYNRFDNEVSWAECDLRDWLNVSFLHSAFSLEERANIVATPIQSERTLINGKVEEHQSTDKVFLLSAKEADQYFATKMTSGYKRTLASDYADSKNVNVRESGCIWWLRSPGAIIRSIGDNVFNDGPNYRRAAIVSVEGVVTRAGLTIWFDKGVRPALWVKKQALSIKTDYANGVQKAVKLNKQIEEILIKSIDGEWPGANTLQCRNELRTIRAAYDSLNDSEKQLVTFYSLLYKLESRIR